MQNLKYHTLNIVSMLFFSFILASTINQVVKYAIAPPYTKPITSFSQRSPIVASRRSIEDYKVLTESGFFQIASPSDIAGEGQSSAGSVSELTLIGTITGPVSIARAMIMKTGEKSPGVFALYRVSNDVTNDVYGNKLVGIGDSRVFLEVGGQRVILELYAKKTVSPPPATPFGATGMQPESAGQQFTQTLSRAEIRQKVFNNLDNALRGLQAGPYRVNGQIAGYRLINVRPYNILYKLGARSGDIVKRINGQTLDSTQKLYAMWEAIKNDPKITVDIERDGKNLRYDFNITD